MNIRNVSMKCDFMMFSVILIILLSIASKSSFARYDEIPSIVKVELDEIQLYIKKKSATNINGDDFRKFLISISKKRKLNDQYFTWNGYEFDYLITDIDFDNKYDVVMGYLYDRTHLIVTVYKSSMGWDKPEVKLFNFANNFSIERIYIHNIDLNKDGINDYYIRLGSTGRLYEKSIDCAWMSSNYSLCLTNASSLPNPEYITSNKKKINYYLSHLNDLDNDGLFEIIQTDFIANDGVARGIYWPNIYKWNGKQYVKSNKLFIKYYKNYACSIIHLHNDDKNSSFYEVKKRLMKLNISTSCD